MAIVKQCDRCGKIYNHYSTTGSKVEYNAFMLVVTNCSNTVELEHSSPLDLCKKCMRELGDFMDMKKIKSGSFSKEDKNDA